MGYVRQANIAHGPQQVNNALAVPNRAPRAGEQPTGANSPRQNELVEEADPEMATVGESDRA